MSDNTIYDDWPVDDNVAQTTSQATEARVRALFEEMRARERATMLPLSQTAIAAIARRLAEVNFRIARNISTPVDALAYTRDVTRLYHEIDRLRAERADLLAHLRPEPLLDLSLLDVPCDCEEDSTEHAPDCPRGLLFYLATLAEKLEKETER